MTSKTATYGTAAANPFGVRSGATPICLRKDAAPRFSVPNATTTRSLSAGSVTSVSRTRVVIRPEVSVPAPAARALRDQSEVPIPAMTYQELQHHVDDRHVPRDARLHALILASACPRLAAQAAPGRP